MKRAGVLLTLAVLGCIGRRGSGPARPAEALPPMQDHPLVVRCRASAAACHQAAWAALRGEGELTGDFAAAAFLVAGCEAGHVPSCGDLAAAFADGRGVPRDDGRACELGLAEACARLSRSGPLMAAVPTAPLPLPLPPPAPLSAAAARRNEADATAYRGWAWSVYPEWHEALGLTRGALERTPPATPGERALMGLAVARRMAAVQRCVPSALAPAPGEEAAPQRTAGVAAFTVGADGRVTSSAVRALPGSVMPESAKAWWRCAEDELAGWVLPVPPSGGRFWLTFPGLGDPAVRAPGRVEPFEPVYATEGYTMPRPKEPRCVAESMQAPYGLEGYSGVFTVRFAVGTDGAPRFFSVVGPAVPPAVVEVVWRAVRGCAWVPARGPDGRPATVWVITPIHFSGR